MRIRIGCFSHVTIEIFLSSLHPSKYFLSQGESSEIRLGCFWCIHKYTYIRDIRAVSVCFTMCLCVLQAPQAWRWVFCATCMPVFVERKRILSRRQSIFPMSSVVRLCSLTFRSSRRASSHTAPNCFRRMFANFLCIEVVLLNVLWMFWNKY